MTPIDLLYHRTKTSPKKTAFIDGEHVWTYQRLTTEVEQLASALTARGLQPGDRVALHMANVPELAVAYYACFRIGAIAAPLNTKLKTAELSALLQRLQPALYIGQTALYGMVVAIDDSILRAGARVVVGDRDEDPGAQSFTRLLAEADAAPLPPTPNMHDPAVLLTTSGTTGQPKFVVHSQASLSAIAETAQHLAPDNGETAIVPVPMVHASGLFTLLTCIRYGASMVLIERFDRGAVLDAIERFRVNWMAGMPFMFAALAESQRTKARNVSSLRTCIASGDVCPPQLQDAFPELFGTPLRSVWGATESLGSLGYGLEPGPVSRIANRALVRLVDSRGEAVPPGEIGELLLRGANVTLGYWAGPGLIEQVSSDGWFRTGDLMRQDDKGNLWFVARKKDLIVRGGSKISPVEVERVLAAHPAVQDAAVVGVPDAELGQRIVGFVQLANDAQGKILQGKILRQILTDIAPQLADHRLPERLEIIGKIPRNALGKIDRPSLLATHAKCAADPRAAGLPHVARAANG